MVRVVNALDIIIIRGAQSFAGVLPIRVLVPDHGGELRLVLLGRKVLRGRCLVLGVGPYYFALPLGALQNSHLV